ncbi:MAG: hypothetical protein R6X02_24075 [Enhygromyxa sp.]
MSSTPRARAPELQGRPAVVAVALVAIALIGGSWWGWSYAGPIGGLLGILLGTAVGALAFTIVRALASAQRFAERPAPDVRELPPDQAVQVLSAMLGASAGEGRGAPVLGGGLLGEIGKARARAEAGDLDGALAKLRGLAEEHPRSPAVPAAIVRVLAGASEHEAERLAAARSAIGLALRGGMNRLATQVYAQLEESERGELVLAGDEHVQLKKALAVQGLGGLADELHGP